MLSVANLDVSIGAMRILRDVSLDVPGGTMVGLIGRNGAGKTTLMKAIMGLLKASGSVRFENDELLRIATHARARMGIGYMPEDRRLIPELTVEENVLLPAWSARLPDTAGRLARTYRAIPDRKSVV